MSLIRFHKAQDRDYDLALAEIKNGRKRSHWIWFIFPQLKGLGFSEKSEYYGIDGIEEAKEYLADDVLSERLIAISSALLELDESDPEKVMGYPDNLKLCSSMTLFNYVSPETEVFQKVLDKYFDGQKDKRTLAILEKLI